MHSDDLKLMEMARSLTEDLHEPFDVAERQSISRAYLREAYRLGLLSKGSNDLPATPSKPAFLPTV